MDSAVTIREGVPEDNDFIFSSWMRSFKSSHYAGVIPDNLYWKVYQVVLEQLLAKPDVRVAVACNSDYPSQIVGYLVYEPGVVHYVYVKRPLRNKGIASFLISNKIGNAFVYTFKTAKSKFIERSFRAMHSQLPARRKPREQRSQDKEPGPKGQKPQPIDEK